MFSSRSLEGYLEIDHRDSPGFTCEEAVAIGFRRIADQLGKGQRVQVPCASCGHCTTQVILNPGRTRDRERCWHCRKYMCDRCSLTYKADGGLCRPFDQVIEEWARAAAQGSHKVHELADRIGYLE